MSTRTVRSSQSTTVTDRDTIRILHLTDPHLFADETGTLRGVPTLASLRSVLRHYRAQSWRADLVFATGDLIHDDSAEAYERFRNEIEGMGLPVACLPGNHDIRDLMQQKLSDAVFSYCPQLRHGDWLLASVDSCVDGKAGGRITRGELEKLDNIIGSTDARHVLVFLHHPPVAMGSEWLDSVGLENADEFMRIVTNHDSVRAVAFGHVHQLYDRRHNGVRIMATPSTCRQFKPGSATFAVDERPPAYRRIELTNDGTIATEVVWVSDD